MALSSITLTKKNCDELECNGYSVLKSVISAADVASLRALVLGRLEDMAKTRRVAHSYHIAGFHRFKGLRPIKEAIEVNPRISQVVAGVFAPKAFRSIGLTDITVNRSQHWHTDLLRGHYAHHLAETDPWDPSDQACIKCLLYLQPGKSLKIVPGSHRIETPLDDTAITQMAKTSAATQISLDTGDVVLMDVRCIHRGSTDDDMQAQSLISSPKILVSSVFGAESSPFAYAMEAGNAQRMADWDSRHLSKEKMKNLMG